MPWFALAASAATVTVTGSDWDPAVRAFAAWTPPAPHTVVVTVGDGAGATLVTVADRKTSVTGAFRGPSDPGLLGLLALERPRDLRRAARAWVAADAVRDALLAAARDVDPGAADAALSAMPDVLPPGTEEGFALACNELAWALTGAGHLPAARRAADRALVLAPHDAAIVDTAAHLAFAEGHADEAIALEEAAIALNVDPEQDEPLRAALARFQGRALPARGVVINDLAGRVPLVVVPTSVPEEARAKLAQVWGGAVRTPDAVAAEERRGPMALYGTPDENPLVAALFAHHHVSRTADALVLGDTTLPGGPWALIATLPNPEDPTATVAVYSAATPDGSVGLHAVRHGWRALTVAKAGEREPLLAVDARLDDAGALVGPALAPASLGAAEAVEDLWTLHDQLRSGWAGYEDAADRRGTSWEAAYAEAEARLRARETWTLAELEGELRAFLAPVRDTHLTVQGVGFVDGAARPVSIRGVVHDEAWVASGRLVPAGDGFAWQGADGAAPIPVPTPPPPLPAETGLVRGATYRLPTVLPDGAPAFLVGVLGGARDLGEAPVAMLPTADGPVPLPLHRLSVGAPAKGAAWSLDEGGKVPVLRVGTMEEAALEGLGAVADPLRARSTVILDLRGNRGGSDRPAHALVGAWSAAPLRVAAGFELRPGTGDRLLRTATFPADTVPGAASETWPARLWVLVDGGVASSGETLTWLADQLPGAVVVGANTAGCTAYGNLVPQRPLPHSGLRATFGHTRFVWDAVHPAIEGTGRFPDLWLDEPDPIAFLSALPAIVAP